MSYQCKMGRSCPPSSTLSLMPESSASMVATSSLITMQSLSSRSPITPSSSKGGASPLAPISGGSLSSRKIITCNKITNQITPQHPELSMPETSSAWAPLSTQIHLAGRYQGWQRCKLAWSHLHQSIKVFLQQHQNHQGASHPNPQSLCSPKPKPPAPAQCKRILSKLLVK